MNREEKPDFIPIDLIPKILPRLPLKSIGRFRCVSKLWGSILSHPRLLFALQPANDELFFFSSPQPQNQYEKSLVVTSHFHTKFHGEVCGYNMCNHTSGLIYLPDYWLSEDAVCVICNPITGQYVTLPHIVSYRHSTSFLGFDSINKQFKVLAEAYPFCPERDRHKFLTLGTGKLRWRKNFDCRPGYYRSLSEGICINGVLYYLTDDERIVCLDVRLEKFKFIDAECFSDPDAAKLINYKGKLGGVELTYNDADAVELCVWVLEDVEKQEWSKNVYTLPEHEVVVYNVFVVGMTAKGDVLSEKFTSNAFYVFYFNLERNTLQSVEIQGVGGSPLFENDCRVYAFVDYVEDLSLKDLCSERDRDRRYDDGRIGEEKHRERGNERDSRQFEDKKKKKKPRRD